MNRPHNLTQTPPHDPLAPVREKLVQALSLAPEGSASHRVEPHGDGLRVTLTRRDPYIPIYTYALPWARGWTVFVTDDAYATRNDWHHCTQGYSCSVPNERNIVGPQNVNIERLISAFIDGIDYMEFHYGEHSTLLTDIAGAIEDEDYFEGEDGDSTDVVFYGLP